MLLVVDIRTHEKAAREAQPFHVIIFPVISLIWSLHFTLLCGIIRDPDKKSHVRAQE